MNRLRDKIIAITGASRGLGEVMAIAFSAEGASLILAARTISDLERVAQLCTEAGAPAVSSVQTDVSDDVGVQHLVDVASQRQGRIDVFVANAATSPANVAPGKRHTDITTYDLSTFEEILDTNFNGVFRCMRAAFPVMKAGGSFITIGSGSARKPRGGNSVYSMSKTGVDMLTKVGAHEMESAGIRVNCLSPGGMTDTNLFGPSKMPENLKKLGYLEADVIVPAAIWLASDDSRDTTGGFVSGAEFNKQSIEDTRAAIAARHVPG